MKVLSQDSLQKPLRRARFEREIEACIRLRHPSIIEIYDYGEHRGQPFYAMELMDAPSMMALVHREGPLSAARILSTLLQIGDALRSCHERGLIHRDVKPHNIVMKESGQAILMDFGLTKVFKKGSLTAPGALIGTPRFLAPEIILGRGASPATDVYALGASLYELATGLPAHPEDRSFDLLLGSILEDPPPSIRDVRPEFPEDVDALIRCMLDKDSAARIPLQSAWRRARSLLKRLHPPTFVSVDGLLNPLARDGLISADSVDGLTSAARAWIDGDGPTPLPADGAGFPNLSLEAVHEGSAPAEKHPSRPPRPTRNTVLIASIGVVLSILLCLWYGSGGAPERAFPPDADRPQAQAFSTKISSAPPPGRTGTGSTPQSADRRRVVTFIKRQIFAGDDYVTVSLESTEAIGLRIELIDAETRKSVHRDESSGPVERIWRMIPGKGRLEQNHNYLLVVEPTEAGVEFIPGVFRVRTQGRRYRAQVQEGFTSFGVTSVSDAFAAGRLHSQRDARTVDKVLDLLLSKDVQRGIESSTFLLLVGTVGRVGDPRSVPRLIRLLDRPRTPQECVTIIEALGEIGDPVATGSVLKAILELARTDHLVSAERLALGLSKLDSRAVSEYARGVIHGGGTHSLAERLMVAMALGNGGRSEFASLLTDLALTDPESSVRRLATSNLLFLPRNSASASYRMLLSPRRPGSGDVDSQVEESALLGLGLTGGALDGPSLVPRLAPDQPRRVRRAAVAALGEPERSDRSHRRGRLIAKKALRVPQGCLCCIPEPGSGRSAGVELGWALPDAGIRGLPALEVLRINPVVDQREDQAGLQRHHHVASDVVLVRGYAEQGGASPVATGQRGRPISLHSFRTAPGQHHGDHVGPVGMITLPQRVVLCEHQEWKVLALSPDRGEVGLAQVCVELRQLIGPPLRLARPGVVEPERYQQSQQRQAQDLAPSSRFILTSDSWIEVLHGFGVMDVGTNCGEAYPTCSTSSNRTHHPVLARGRIVRTTGVATDLRNQAHGFPGVSGERSRISERVAPTSARSTSSPRSLAGRGMQSTESRDEPWSAGEKTESTRAIGNINGSFSDLPVSDSPKRRFKDWESSSWSRIISVKVRVSKSKR